MDNYPVFSKQVAKEILTIIDEISNDIDEGEFLNAIRAYDPNKKSSKNTLI